MKYGAQAMKQQFKQIKLDDIEVFILLFFSFSSFVSFLFTWISFSIISSYFNFPNFLAELTR